MRNSQVIVWTRMATWAKWLESKHQILGESRQVFLLLRIAQNLLSDLSSWRGNCTQRPDQRPQAAQWWSWAFHWPQTQRARNHQQLASDEVAAPVEAVGIPHSSRDHAFNGWVSMCRKILSFSGEKSLLLPMRCHNNCRPMRSWRYWGDKTGTWEVWHPFPAGNFEHAAQRQHTPISCHIIPTSRLNAEKLLWALVVA